MDYNVPNCRLYLQPRNVPHRRKIDKLKKQALRLLPEKIRKETDWQAKELILRNVDIYVLVDGMNDKSAEEKVALELKI